MWVLVLFLVVIVLAFHVGASANRRKVRIFLSDLNDQYGHDTRYTQGWSDAIKYFNNALITRKFRSPWETKGTI